MTPHILIIQSVYTDPELSRRRLAIWYVRVHLRSYDAAKLVAFFERMKQEG